MSVAPITPEEARKEAQKQHLTIVIPDEVYETVNELLIERYNYSDIIIYQGEVIARAIKKMQSDGTSVPHEDFFTHHWLDFESPYIDAGWIVSYEGFKRYWLFHKNDE